MADLQYALVIYGFYPLWLIAGAVDYFCHRHSAIHATSGIKESHLHVAQFVCIALIIGVMAKFSVHGAILVLLALLVSAHTFLSYVDVRFTQPRRYISVVEQHAHGFLDVLPLVAVAVIAVADLQTATGEGWVNLRQPALASWQLSWLLLSVVLAGSPVLEEWLRVARSTSRDVS
jgi:hypothetical protein